jgi:hypothetical protein
VGVAVNFNEISASCSSCSSSNYLGLPFLPFPQ